MKIRVRSTESILVIDKSKKPWEMNGNKGVVYTALCHQKIGDEVQVEKVRITEEVYSVLEPMRCYIFDATVDIRNNKLEVYNAFEDVPDNKPGFTSGSTFASDSGDKSSGKSNGKSR